MFIMHVLGRKGQGRLASIINSTFTSDLGADWSADLALNLCNAMLGTNCKTKLGKYKRAMLLECDLGVAGSHLAEMYPWSCQGPPWDLSGHLLVLVLPPLTGTLKCMKNRGPSRLLHHS